MVPRQDSGQVPGALGEWPAPHLPMSADHSLGADEPLNPAYSQAVSFRFCQKSVSSVTASVLRVSQGLFLPRPGPHPLEV